MPFFMVDDQFQVSRKTTALIEQEGAAGAQAIGLWTLAGSLAQAKLSDGLISTGDLVRVLLDRTRALKAAKLLVKHELWHAPGHDCDKCDDVPDGCWRFHDWFAMGYDPGAKVIQTRERRKELKQPEILDAVWDRDQSMCRYCRRKVNRRGGQTNKGTLDHVIPGMAMGVTNLVVCCLACNQKKGQRTPEQAGMTLLAPPDQPESDANRIKKEASSIENPDEINEESRSELNQNQADFDSKTAANDLSNPLQPSKNGDHKKAKQKFARQLSDIALAPPHMGRVRAGSGTGSGSGPRQGPAGSAPDVGTPGQFGSPWHAWRGPPPASDESTCSDHGLDLPCRRCATARLVEENP